MKGIGGPGAPHLFRLERVRDAGLICVTMVVKPGYQLVSLPVSLACLPGLSCEELNTKFWRRRGVEFGQSDVVLRTGLAGIVSNYPMSWLSKKAVANLSQKKRTKYKHTIFG